jgi:hypothetical protein
VEWTSSEVIGVITYLLPGFVAAWVFYGLTTHPRKTPFERVIQAVIFTAIIQGIVAGGRLIYEHYHAQGLDWGEWGEISNQVIALIVAVVIGLSFAALANNDWVHAVLRWACITRRTSYSSNWYSALKQRRYVTLHLKGRRRVYGWPYEFPDQPKNDVFVLMNAFWVPDEGDPIPLPQVERLVVRADDVRWIELMKPVTTTITEEQANGERSTAAPTEPCDGQQGDARSTTDSANQTGSVATPANTTQKAVNGQGNRIKSKRRRRNGRRT